MELQGYQFIDRLHQGIRQDFWRLLPDGGPQHLLAKLLSDDRASVRDYAAFRRESGYVEKLGGLDIAPPRIGLRGGGVAGIAYDPQGGQLLSLHVERNGSMSVDGFLDLALHFCDRLASLHDQQLLATNFHPARWLWNENTGKLWFLGLDGVVEASGHTKDIQPEFGLDELVYMSPEQFGTLPYDANVSSDIYGLGCLFFYLLCSRPPFRGASRLNLAQEQLTGQGMRLKQYRPKLPVALCQIVEQMMQPNVDNRYRSLGVLRRDLDLCRRKSQSGQLDVVSIGRRERQARLAFPERFFGDSRILSRLRDSWQRAMADTRQGVMLTGPSHEMHTRLVEELRQTVLVSRGLTIIADAGKSPAADGVSGPVIRQLLEKVACALPSIDGDFVLPGRVLAELRPEAASLLHDFAPGLADLLQLPVFGPTDPPGVTDDLIADLVVELFDCLLMPGRPLLLVVFEAGNLDRLDMAVLKGLMERPGPKLMTILTRQAHNAEAVRQADQIAQDDDRPLDLDVLHVAAMTRQQLSQYLAETLSVSQEMVSGVADCLMRKCEAWPEELRVCLERLHDQGSIWYEPVWQRWTWSMNSMDGLAPGLVKLDRLVAGIKSLRGDMQIVLLAAACHRDLFDLQSVAKLCGLEARYVRAAVAEAQKSGILVADADLFEEQNGGKQDDVRKAALDDYDSRIWRFSHPVLQQVAGKASLPNDPDIQYLRHLLHLFWRGNLAPEYVFHLADLSMDALPRLEADDYPVVVDLLVEVLSMTDGDDDGGEDNQDFRSKCRNVAWSLVRPGDWGNHHERCMYIGRRILDSLYAPGDTDRFDALVADMLPRCRTPEERFQLKIASMDRYARLDMQDEVIRTGLEILAGLGVWLPSQSLPSLQPLSLWWAYSRTGYMTGNVQGLAQVMAPGRIRHVMDVAGRILTVIGNRHHPVVQPLFIMMLRLTRRHGWHEASGLALSLYAWRISSLPGGKAQARAWGQLPLELSGIRETPIMMARICLLNGLVEASLGNQKMSLALYERGCSSASDDKDRHWALACGRHRLVQGFYAGEPLQDLRVLSQSLSHDGRPDVEPASFLARQATDHALEMLLEGKADTGLPDADAGVLAGILLHCMIAEFDRAWSLWCQDNSVSGHGWKHNSDPHYVFISMLTILAAANAGHPDMDSFNSGPVMRFMEKRVRQQAGLQGARTEILQAELLRYDGRQDEALDLLERAVDQARQDSNHIEEILASLRLADILDLPGREEERRRALRFARNAALSWGSAPLAAILEEKYGEILMGPAPEQNRNDLWQTARLAQPQGLDIEAMSEASRIISGEVRLGELLKKMMRMVAGVAAAERGVLILEHDGDWQIQAELSGGTDQVSVLGNTALSSGYVATSIIHYVIRTAEPVVLDDAGRDPTFANDPYLLRQAPRSLICLPLLNQSTIRAVLYLENNIVSGAFASKSVEVLSLLSSQMAVSIENARLYERMETVNDELRDLNVNLEHTVSERTSALIDKSAVLESTFETMRDGLIAFDRDGNTREYNSEIIRMFGLPADSNLHDLGYRSVFRAFVLHAIFEDQAMDENQVEREVNLLTDPLVQNPDRTEYELEIRTAGGRNLQLQFRRLNDGDGWMLKCVDVTENRQRETQLRSAITRAEAANEAKSRFLATMSHEIRTPMNGVMGMIDLLQDTRLDREQRELTRIVGDSAGNLLNIIDEILDFSKIEAGKFAIELVEFGLRDLIDQVIELMAPRANLKGLELALHIDADIPELLSGDPARIRQVLINLVGNAIKFTAAGHIALVITTDQDLDEARSLRFEIRDTGAGLSDAAQARLFEAFEQGDASTTRQFGGTGLGLAISKSLVELMGGRIDLESREGKGSVFWFSLPFQVVGDQPCFGSIDLGGLDVGVAAELPVLQSGLEAMLSRCDITVVRPGSNDWLEAKVVVLDEFRHPGDALPVNVPVIRLVSYSHASNAETASSGDRETRLTKPVRRNSLLQEVAILTGRASRESFADDVEQRVGGYTAPSRQDALHAGGLLLVAEDNETNRTVIQRQMNRLGFACDIVENGAEAWRALDRTDYGLVLTDCHMPEMDGYELAGKIRAAENTRQDKRRLPVVALTANALAGESAHAIQQGMDDFLSKPVKLQDLEATLLRWVPVLSKLRQQDVEQSAGDAIDDFLVQPEGDEAPSGNMLKGPAPEIMDLELVLSVFGALNEDAMQMIDRFVETTAPDITALLAARPDTISKDDCRHLSHQVAGAARTAGATKVAEIGKRMEQLVLEGDLDGALENQQRLDAAWQEIEKFVHELRASV